MAAAPWACPSRVLLGRRGFSRRTARPTSSRRRARPLGTGFALERTNIGAPSALPEGKHTIVCEFIPDEAKPGTGGSSILIIDGQKVSEGHIPKTQPFMFSADEGTDIGQDGETNVSPDYKERDNKFTGKIHKVTIELKETTSAQGEEVRKAMHEAPRRKVLPN